MVSKALLAAEYRKKLTALSAGGDIELLAGVPASWGGADLEPGRVQGYSLQVLPTRWSRSFHLHHYPTLGRVLERVRPDLLHIDEEPYNLATAHAIWEAHWQGIPAVFFTWQNINRRYPPPFSWIEAYCYRTAVGAIAGTSQAAGVLRAKGYRGPLAQIPQFGVDAESFRPQPSPARAGELVIGFAGRFIESKGLRVLLQAAKRLDPLPLLKLAGDGPLAGLLREQAAAGPLAGRIKLNGQLPSNAMPDFLRSIDVLVLPSLDTANWKEQFGRVLVEAMACSCPVIGSDSGAIPLVIGDAGLIVPQGDAQALAEALRRLSKPAARERLGRSGRQRALSQFTHRQIAIATRDFYNNVCNTSS